MNIYLSMYLIYNIYLYVIKCRDIPWKLVIIIFALLLMLKLLTLKSRFSKHSLSRNPKFYSSFVDFVKEL